MIEETLKCPFCNKILEPYYEPNKYICTTFRCALGGYIINKLKYKRIQRQIKKLKQKSYSEGFKAGEQIGYEKGYNKGYVCMNNEMYTESLKELEK